MLPPTKSPNAKCLFSQTRLCLSDVYQCCSAFSSHLRYTEQNRFCFQGNVVKVNCLWDNTCNVLAPIFPFLIYFSIFAWNRPLLLTSTSINEINRIIIKPIVIVIIIIILITIMHQKFAAQCINRFFPWAWHCYACVLKWFKLNTLFKRFHFETLFVIQIGFVLKYSLLFWNCCSSSSSCL
jgi:hypothetical protein